MNEYCDICGSRSIGNRHRTGPTGKNNIFILVDQCIRCGALYPIQKIDHKAKVWVERYNKRMKKLKEIKDQYEEELKQKGMM